MLYPPCLRVLLAASVLLPSLAVAQKTAPVAARVEHVVVRGSGDAVEVEIQTSGAKVEPNTQAIAGPDRIVVDFPGAIPAPELRAMKVKRGGLKGVRSGLFFSNPPITRVVLDLDQAEPYQISTSQNAVVVRLGTGKPAASKPSVVAAAAAAPSVPTAHTATLQNASLDAGAGVAAPRVTEVVPAPASSSEVSAAPADAAAANPDVANEQPPPPPVTVSFENGMLRIHAERATLAQVLFEVHRQTHAEIAIPAGAEQEEVFADLGPAPAREVLGSLLNGSPYNFIFVGRELNLEQVILTRRQSNPF